jgi:hypothetical protein
MSDMLQLVVPTAEGFLTAKVIIIARPRQAEAYRTMKTLIFVLVILCSSAQAQEKPETVYDPQKNLTIVRSQSFQLARDKDSYHSLEFTLSCEYQGQARVVPQRISFDLVSVVKARRLNTDLYVVFLVDDKEIHFSSNRSAVPSPVPGRLWVGERLAFLIPYEDFAKLVNAKRLSIKMGTTTFDLNNEARDSMRAFINAVK